MDINMHSPKQGGKSHTHTQKRHVLEIQARQIHKCCIEKAEYDLGLEEKVEMEKDHSFHTEGTASPKALRKK